MGSASVRGLSHMNKIVCTAVAAFAGVALAPSTVAAQNATGVGAYNMFVTGANAGTFGNSAVLAPSTFTNTFTFVVTQGGLLSSDFTNTATGNNTGSDIDFSSAVLTGGSLASSVSYDRLVGEPISLTEAWAITPISIDEGTYTLTISGQPYSSTATFSGNFNVEGVPEPTTWAMMIGGFGMIGGAMRRRRGSTKVRFA